MANIRPKTLSFTQGNDTYTIRGITSAEETKIANALTSHQDITGKLDTSLKGAANGLAELDANGKVPSSQLPSYVDDVLEYDAKTGNDGFPVTGETGKIYVDKSDGKTYRWSGSAYIEISSSGLPVTSSSDAGKFLVVGSTGEIEAVTMTAWSGGSY